MKNLPENSFSILKVLNITAVTTPLGDFYYLLKSATMDYVISAETACGMIDDLGLENPDGEQGGPLGCKVRVYSKY